MREPPRIKICGLRDPEHAVLAAELGAWAIGLVFADGSPRRVGIDEARAVAAVLPPSIARVGVFVDAPAATIAQVVAAVGLTHVQVHGTTDVAALRAACDRPVILGVGVDGTAALAAAVRSDADLLLLDAAVAGQHGGTGQSPDWALIGAHGLRRPFLLAGGLTPENVGNAIAMVTPWGVDVSSGVESARGVKDAGRIAAFMAAVGEAAAARSTV